MARVNHDQLPGWGGSCIGPYWLRFIKGERLFRSGEQSKSYSWLRVSDRTYAGVSLVWISLRERTEWKICLIIKRPFFFSNTLSFCFRQLGIFRQFTQMNSPGQECARKRMEGTRQLAGEWQQFTHPFFFTAGLYNDLCVWNCHYVS